MRRDDRDPDRDEAVEERGPLTVEPASLSKAALRGVVEAFVLREGTDYGTREVELERKVADVMRQLESGEARIVFDPGTESVDIQLVPPRRRRKP